MNNQKLQVHQYHHSVSSADAVSNQMFFIQDCLREIGIEGTVFGSQLKGLPKSKAKIFEMNQAWDCDLFLIHHSQGNPELKKLSRLEIPKALIYHNITPPHFFAHDTFIADLCKLGRRQLSHLKTQVIASFADSQYNADELRKLGYPETKILPLFDLSKSLRIFPEKEFDKTAPKNVLFVGRVTHHKNQAQILEVFYYLQELLPKHSKLFLVGSQDPIYTDYLKLYSKQLGIEKSVHFTGSVTQSALENYYESADAFVVLSQHEGFCIPVIEAMAAHTPVFAFPTTGVRDTLGQSGIALHTHKSREIAQIIATVLEDEQTVGKIISGQNKHLEKMKLFQSRKVVQDLISSLVNQVRMDPKLTLNL